MAEANQINCPHCGQSYAVRPEQWAQYDGKTINCTKCGQAFVVKALAPPMAPPRLAGMTPPPIAAPAGQAVYVPGLNAPYPPGPPINNGWAVTSLIVGIVGFCIPLIGGVGAIIAGIVGLLKTRDPRVGGKGLAIAGISLGGLSCIISPLLLIAILVPALGQSREQTNRVACSNNMRQLGQAMMMYASNNGGHFPDKLEDVLQADPSIPPTVFVCPSDDKAPPSNRSVQTEAHQIADGQHCSFIYAGSDLTTSSPRDSVLLYEPLGNHHFKGSNVLYADGHVEWVDAAEAEKIAAQEALERPAPTTVP